MSGAGARIVPRLDLMPASLGVYGFLCRRRGPSGLAYGPALRTLRPGTPEHAAAAAEIEAAMRVLTRDAVPLPRCGPGRVGTNSYTLKHIVERRAGLYVSNGSLLGACVLLGIAVRREAADGPNGVCAIALKDEEARDE